MKILFLNGPDLEFWKLAAELPRHVLVKQNAPHAI